MKWTKQEERFIEDNKNIKSCVLARLMGRSELSVSSKRERSGVKSTGSSSGTTLPRISFNSYSLMYAFRPTINGAIKLVCKSYSLIECLDNLDSYNEAVKAGFIQGDLL